MYIDDRKRIERPHLDLIHTKNYLRQWKDDVYNPEIRKKRRPLLIENRSILAQLKDKPPKNKRKKLEAKLKQNRLTLAQDDHQIIKANEWAAMIYIVEQIIAQQCMYMREMGELNLHAVDVESGSYCLFTNNAKLKRGCGTTYRSTSWRMTERLKTRGFVTERTAFSDRDYKLFISLKFLPFLDEGEAPNAFKHPLLPDGATPLPLNERCKLQPVTLTLDNHNPVKADKESRPSRDGQLRAPRKETPAVPMEHKEDGKTPASPNDQPAELSDQKKEQGARGPAADGPEDPFAALKRQTFMKFWALVLKMLYAGRDLNHQLEEKVQQEVYSRYFGWIRSENDLEQWYLLYIKALQNQKNYAEAKEHRFTKWPDQFFGPPPPAKAGPRKLEDFDLSTFHGHILALQNNAQRDQRRKEQSRRYRKERHYQSLIHKYWQSPDTPTYIEVSRKVAKMGEKYSRKFQQSLIQQQS